MQIVTRKIPSIISPNLCFCIKKKERQNKSRKLKILKLSNFSCIFILTLNFQIKLIAKLFSLKNQSHVLRDARIAISMLYKFEPY